MSTSMIPELKRLYDKKYGEIPEDADARLEFLLSTFKSNRWQKTFLETMKRAMNITWKVRKFTFYVIPQATPRPRGYMRGNHVHFYVKGADAHKKFIKYFLKIMKEEDIEIIQTAVRFDAKVFMPIPSAMKDGEKVCAELGYINPTTKPDWDNLAKTYCDMINELIISDDKNIIHGCLEKFYSVKPRIEITLRYASDFDSDFNQKKCIRKVGSTNGE